MVQRPKQLAQVNDLRLLPQNQDAERAVLGAMLLSHEALDEALETLRPADFYNPTHRTIFEALVQIASRGEAVDLVSVTETLRRAGQLEAVGGATYITALANYVPTPANVGQYAAMVREKATLRSIIRAAGQVMALAYQGDLAALDLAQRVFDELEAGVDTEEPMSYRDVLVELSSILERRHDAKSPVTGVPTGYPDLDMMTSGFQPGELAIIGGRPSMGKSAFARCVMENAAARGVPVLMFSLEDTRQNVAQRSVAGHSRVSNTALRCGFIGDETWDKLLLTMGRLSDLPIWIYDRSGLTPADVRRVCRRQAKERGLGLVIVDYIQLMKPVREREKRHDEVSDIVRDLKAIGKELNVPMVVVSQLSREAERTADNRPQLSHLKESGDLEQVADLVLLLYRDEYYNRDSDKRGIAEVIVAKNKQGMTGSVELQWDADTVTFRSLAK